MGKAYITEISFPLGNHTVVSPVAELEGPSLSQGLECGGRTVCLGGWRRVEIL